MHTYLGTLQTADRCQAEAHDNTGAGMCVLWPPVLGGQRNGTSGPWTWHAFDEDKARD